jgi:flagellar protein FlaG
VKEVNISAIEMNSVVSETSAGTSSHKQNTFRPAQNVRENSVSNEQIRRQVAEMERQISRMNVRLTFSTYGDQGENIAIVVADKETGEVIREIPSKEIQNLYAKMSELTGLILNGQA